MEALHEDYEPVPVPQAHDFGYLTPEQLAIRAIVDAMETRREACIEPPSNLETEISD